MGCRHVILSHPCLHDDNREKVVACLFAAATDLGTDAAVLMVSGMPFALVGRGEAGRRTRFEHLAEDAEIWRALPRHDAAGRLAGVGAVEAETNDTDQFLHIVFAQTGVGAGGTASGTIEALVDAA